MINGTDLRRSPLLPLYFSLVHIRHDEQMKMGKFISQKITIEREDLALVTVKKTAFIELSMIMLFFFLAFPLL